MQSLQRVILVHYHEIGLKGKNRGVFEGRLEKNLKALLTREDLVNVHEIERLSGRLIVVLDEETTLAEALSCAEYISAVPGVARASCGFSCERSMEGIGDAAVCALGECGDFLTFKVQARRNHTDFAIDSMQMNRDIGSVLCEAFPDKQVRMKLPDVEVHIEVIQNRAYVFAYSTRGIGGLPVGTSGRLACLLSSGIDSPVALWRMARRGAICVGVHFSGSPLTSDASEYLVEDIGHVLERTGCIARIYSCGIGEYQREISLVAPPPLRVLLYRRLMFRVAERIATAEGAKGLVTGESLGQVASQTIDNIAAVACAVSMPILRPLIGTDKLEIINEAQRLGTFEISSQDAPDCCTLFMPRSPETHAKIQTVNEAEALYPVEAWVEDIVASATHTDFFCPPYRS